MKKVMVSNEKIRKRLPLAGAACGVAAAVLLAAATGGFSGQATAQGNDEFADFPDLSGEQMPEPFGFDESESFDPMMGGMDPMMADPGMMGMDPSMGMNGGFDEFGGGMPYGEFGGNPFGAPGQMGGQAYQGGFEPFPQQGGMGMDPMMGGMDPTMGAYGMDPMMGGMDPMMGGYGMDPMMGGMDPTMGGYGFGMDPMMGGMDPMGGMEDEMTPYQRAMMMRQVDLADPNDIADAEILNPDLTSQNQRTGSLVNELTRLQEEIAYQQRVLELQSAVRDRLSIEEEILNRLNERKRLEDILSEPEFDPMMNMPPWPDTTTFPPMGGQGGNNDWQTSIPEPPPAPPTITDDEPVRPPLRPAPVVVEMYGADKNISALLLTSDDSRYRVSTPGMAIGGWEVVSLEGGRVTARPLGYTAEEWPAQELGVGVEAPSRLPDPPASAQ